MHVNFSVKNVPPDVAELLRRRAERNHRSLQGELLAILERAARDVLPDSPQQSAGAASPSVEESLQRLRSFFPSVAAGGTPSATLLRELRDQRYGETWADSGEQPDAH